MNSFDKLVGIIARLRAPNGCPWDREQTPKTILSNIIEEAYEAAEAIEDGDWDSVKEELGDLLLQIVLQSQMANEKGRFKIDDVIKGINEKLIRRHPHVFGKKRLTSTKEVVENWEKIKKTEKKKRSGLLGGLPESLPALHKAHRIGVKASRVGFDFPNLKEVLKKLKEETGELEEAVKGKNQDEINHEFGDVLFALANVARHLHIHPEEALRRANKRFIGRFKKMEKMCDDQKIDLKKLSLAELDALWEKSKE